MGRRLDGDGGGGDEVGGGLAGGGGGTDRIAARLDPIHRWMVQTEVVALLLAPYARMGRGCEWSECKY